MFLPWGNIVFATLAEIHLLLIALVLGLVYGVVAAYAGWGDFTADWIAPFGTIFLRLLLLVAVPLVLASLITGIASLSDLNKLSRIGGKTIAIYLGTTLIALLIGLVLVNLMSPGRMVPDGVRARLQEPYQGDVAQREALVFERRSLPPPGAGGAGGGGQGPGPAAAAGRHGAG